MWIRAALPLFFCILAIAQVQPQATVQIKDIQIPRISSKPSIEEFLNGNSRADMKRIDDFRQRQPGDGQPVSRKTSAWLGYDDKNFYVVFVCQSPPGATRARLAKREDIFSDDFVGIFLDTYHDRQRSYEFFVNPFGIQADAIESEGQDDDLSFDTLWYSDGQLTPEGFVASMSIPFKSLRFSSSAIQNWGLGLGRFIPETNENAFWPFITQKVDGFSRQLGNMSGLQDISPGRNIRFTPYGAFGSSHFLDIPAIGDPSFKTQNTPRAGLDVKAVIHDSLTLDIALNPDFSQVESDDPQVTVNQRYEVQFPEKRPFFLENNGYFVTPENLFFSRRIIDPEYGARLTGKLGRWNVGFLAIDDRAPGAALGPVDPNRDTHAIISIARVQREFAKDSNIGFLATDREFAGSFNRVGALDTRLKFNANWTFNGQAISSQTRDLDGAKSGGDAFNASLHGQNREWQYDLKYIDRSEGFRADLGFIQRVNIRQAQQNVSRRFHPKSKKILSWSPQLYMSGDFDHRNVQQDWSVREQLNVEMPRTTFIGFGHTEIFERFNNINFRRNDNSGGFHTEYFKRATFDAGYSKGTRINYDVVSNLPAFLGNGSEFQASVTLRPFSRLKLDEIYYLTRLYTAGPQPEVVFINHLARSRATYQFTRELSLRLILDYNGVLQNPALISLDRQKRVTGDVLLTYLLHPGTAFYIGVYGSARELGAVPRPGEPNSLPFYNYGKAVLHQDQLPVSLLIKKPSGYGFLNCLQLPK